MNDDQRDQMLIEISEKLGKLEISVCGNGSPGLNQRVQKLENAKPCPPRMSWKQIIFTLSIYLAVATFVWGFESFMISDLSSKITVFDQRLHDHEVKP